RAEMNVIGCHTNLDTTQGGVNDVLAASLGLGNTVPLVPEGNDLTCGLGRIGREQHGIPGGFFGQTTKSDPLSLVAGSRASA
ncbi:MAG: Nif3-like dinuclear metal center hexameric protein, partial [Candidatus Electrothrix sp. AR3]|nr:Nif3-like dinuclear metal center hexameric protein [Candidatus Electrothrix sp. AR3]